MIERLRWAPDIQPGLTHHKQEKEIHQCKMWLKVEALTVIHELNIKHGIKQGQIKQGMT